MRPQLTDMELRALLHRRDAAIEAVREVRDVLPVVEALFVPGEYLTVEAMREVAEASAAELRAILDRVAEAGILEAGAYGPKIASRITLAAERLDACAVLYARGGPKVASVRPWDFES